MRRLAALLLLASPSQAEEVTVFAAASLKTALDEIATAWEGTTGHEVTLSYAGTPQLAQQIEQGAPADLFISASTDWMDDLQAKDLIDPASRRDLLGNTLVLVAHGEASPVEIDPDLDLSALLGDGRLAMAFIDSVPAGIYGREALTSLGLWDAVAPQVAQAENVRAALALVASGEAPLGIVYDSDALASQAAGEDVSTLGTFPADSHSPITYPAALVAGRHNPAAAQLLNHLASEEARAVWEVQGFTVPD
jgi:molybdate transport system substrate-binding protein